MLKNTVLSLLFCLSFLYASELKVTAVTGSPLSKGAPLLAGTIINSGDTITSKVNSSISITDSVTVSVKENSSVLFAISDNAVRISLLTGQMFINKKFKAATPLYSMYGGKCLFTPIGTAAAIKVVKSGKSSVAVIKGKVRMTSPEGKTQDVSSGEVSSFDPTTSTFAPVKHLPLQAISSIKDWSGYLEEESAESVVENEPDEKMDNTEVSSTVDKALEAPKDESSETGTEKTLTENVTPAKSSPESDLSTGKNDKVVAEKQTEEATPSKSETVSMPNGAIETKPSEDKNKEVETKQDSSASQKPEEVTGKSKKENEKKSPTGAVKPVWELSAGMVTVDNEQWTRLALAVDVPIWKFGVCFDLELFMDSKGNFSNKGWNFDNGREAATSLLRKIRYIRFNHEGDPVFIKVGALSSVTYEHGFVLNSFSNMLNYPGEKLFGVQFDLNDISPIGLTLKTMIPDLKDFRNDGGIIAANLGLRPLKALDKPVISKITLSGTYVTDLNQYASAREWDYTLSGPANDKDEDGVMDGDWWDATLDSIGDTLTSIQKNTAIAKGLYDTLIEAKDKYASRQTDKATVVGADLNIPVISTKVLNFDIYGQYGLMLDDNNETDKFYKGWGIGAPGAYLNVGPFWAQVEYRYTRNKFEPGYFDSYYLEERITRYPLQTKEETMTPYDLNGVFGKLGFNIKDVLIIDGTYQWMNGDDFMRQDTIGGVATLVNDKNIDQRFEGVAKVGSLLLSKIPKLNKLEAFYYQTNIDGNAFQKSVDTYWGYRVGSEVVGGAGINIEVRYGWVRDGDELEDNKSVVITAGLSF